MKKSAFLFIIILCSLSAFPQVPGYQGKRLSLEYSNYFFPALLMPNAKGDYNTDDAFSFKKKLFTLNTRNKLSIDYILSRRTSIGGGFEFFKSRFVFFEKFECESTEGEVLVSSDYPAGNVAARIFNVHYTIFKRKLLAPLGRYTQFEFGVISYKSSYDENALLKDVQNSFYHDFTEIPSFRNRSPYNASYLGITFGKKRVFFDKLIVNSGIQFAYVIDSKPFGDVFFLDSRKVSENIYLQRMGKNRISSSMMLNLQLGVGLLIN